MTDYLLPSARRWLVALAPALLLAGCVQHNVHSLVKPNPEPVAPEQQVADYLAANCEDVWQLQGHVVENNPLFWLRWMDCADRLSPEQARVMAHRWPDETWQAAFRQGIVLANARITPTERRRYMSVLNSAAWEIPPSVRPLFQLWRDGQFRELKLVSERGRYNKLQQNSDIELDVLRQQNTHLQSQLSLTTRKLENLTDIERQLSSRKVGTSYNPDSANSAVDKAKPQDADDDNDTLAPGDSPDKGTQENTKP